LRLVQAVSLELSRRLGYLRGDQLKEANDLLNEIMRMLNSMIGKITP
jgi:hypothetical protein